MRHIDVNKCKFLTHGFNAFFKPFIEGLGACIVAAFNLMEQIMKIAYSVTYTTYDAQVRAHREGQTWISGARGQVLTKSGIEKLLKKNVPEAIVIRTETWGDNR